MHESLEGEVLLPKKARIRSHQVPGKVSEDSVVHKDMHSRVTGLLLLTQRLLLQGAPIVSFIDALLLSPLQLEHPVYHMKTPASYVHVCTLVK